jgi:tyrosyl-tRNA synthetase
MSYIERISKLGEEVLTRKELEGIFNYEMDVNAYDGFELSGIPHIAQVILKAHNVNQLIKCGCKFKIWIADIFTLLNNKMGGDMKKIKIIGEYMIEVWKAAGMKMENVEFLWASEEINKNPELYWKIVLDISRKFSVNRIKRCIPALGRSKDVKKDYEEHKLLSEKYKTEGNFKLALEELEKANQLLEKMDDNTPLSYLLYSAMQTADVFFLDAHICQLGMDQRKVNMLAREYCEMINKEKNPVVPHRIKPIIISHHMLMGLQQGEDKMSKSKPESGIFVTDTANEVIKKIKKAYCIPKVVKDNPILDYVKHLIFPILEEEWFDVNRKFESNISFKNYEDLEKTYLNGDLHPSDLKPAVAREINRFLEPIRQHFEKDEHAKSLLKQVKSFKITR